MNLQPSGIFPIACASSGVAQAVPRGANYLAGSGQRGLFAGDT